eukprot:SAG11_NODE_1819_length_4212_cov_12.081935_2_plen_70_part_00
MVKFEDFDVQAAWDKSDVNKDNILDREEVKNGEETVPSFLRARLRPTPRSPGSFRRAWAAPAGGGSGPA